MKTGRIPEKKTGKPEKNCAADCGNRTGQTDGTYESPENPEIARRASVNHIASYLLMTPESLSRVRAGVL